MRVLDIIAHWHFFAVLSPGRRSMVDGRWSMVDGTPSVKQVPRTGGKLGFRGDVAAKPGVDRSTGQDVVFEFPVQE